MKNCEKFSKIKKETSNLETYFITKPISFKQNNLNLIPSIYKKKYKKKIEKTYTRNSKLYRPNKLGNVFVSF